MQPAIRVENLSKRYRLGATRVDNNLTENLKAGLGRVWRGLTGREKAAAPESSEFWALKDVSFEVKPGEVVGIIGRNGAGKSTLLKVLSRIVEPTGGRATVRGRMGSLLEVGTGFHPELSGRENIYLNGSILGMSQKEIARKFDEIVAFSEIEKFLDTPVKRYSSGMYVRLAFAVAAHLEPEILIVDEVLAVGDAGFQKKCIQKLSDVAGHGRTVLIVSHNISTITRLCTRAVLLQTGKLTDDGDPATVGSRYLRGSALAEVGERVWNNLVEAPGDDTVRLRRVRLLNDRGITCESVKTIEPVGFELEYEVLRDNAALTPNVHIYNSDGICVFITIDTDPEWGNRPRPRGLYRSTVWCPANYLNESVLSIDVAITTLSSMTVHVHEREALSLTVTDSVDNQYTRGAYHGTIPGAVRPHLRWATKLLS